MEQKHLVLGAFELHAHDNLAFLRELDGVADEVDENLPQTHRIANHDVGHIGRNVAQKLQAAAMGANGEQLERIDQAVAQGELDRIEFELARFDLG